MKARVLSAAVLLMSISAIAQTSSPATQPASDQGGKRSATTQPSPDQVLDDLLKPPADISQPLTRPSTGVDVDKTSGRGAITPSAPVVHLLPEGSYIIDRVARLGHSNDGLQSELVFESDGKTLRDPPMIILPNMRLTMMENAIAQQNRDLKFRVTGMVTEYHGRNYILLEKVSVMTPDAQEF